jgi:hypothetical protein
MKNKVIALNTIKWRCIQVFQGGFKKIFQSEFGTNGLATKMGSTTAKTYSVIPTHMFSEVLWNILGSEVILEIV